MLLKNLDLKMGLVNGVSGKVISFARDCEGGELLPLIRWKTRNGDLTKKVKRLHVVLNFQYD